MTLFTGGLASVYAARMQVRGWCQDSCLNRARQRRRHRRAIEDWAHLYDHALSADLSPDFLKWLPDSGWHWPARDGDDPQVGLCPAVLRWKVSSKCCADQTCAWLVMA